MVCFITAGGTGGHIFPGIALFNELKGRGHTVFFLGGKQDHTFEAVQRLGNRHIAIPAAPLYYPDFKPGDRSGTLSVFICIVG